MYELKEAEVLSSYEFLTETKYTSDGLSYQSPPAEFEYKGYKFSTAIDPADPMGSYCKSFALIGVNDTNCSIAYCYFYDLDLDTFGSTEIPEQQMITEFIDKYFYWNDISK